MKIAFIIPGLGIGGVETVFINLLSAMEQYSDAEIYVFSHNKITEPIYKEFFEQHKNIKLCIYYPSAKLFNDIQKYCRITPLKQIRQLFFHIYKFFKNRQNEKKITKNIQRKKKKK